MKPQIFSFSLPKFGFRPPAYGWNWAKSSIEKHQESKWLGSKKVREMLAKRTNTVDLKAVSPTEVLRKFFAEVKPDKGQALTESVFTGIRAAIHRHLTLCSTQPKNKHFARQRIHVCQQNVWSESQAIYEKKQLMQNQNINPLFSLCIMLHCILFYYCVLYCNALVLHSIEM